MLYEQPLNLLDEVARYYSKKIQEYGESPLGVDWNSEEGQVLRFEQLLKVLQPGTESGFSLIDLGCGYGALYSFIQDSWSEFRYYGYDVSFEMIAAAKRRYQNVYNAQFFSTSLPHHLADYTVASGIFNVRLGRSDAEWLFYVKQTLDVMHASSAKGFAFNCLTSYSDPPKMRDYLYYADPCQIFNLCKTNYSDNIALLHDYGLYEFTVLIKK